MKSQKISKSILSFLIFLVTYMIEWYRLPKKCIVELVAIPDNFPPIISNIDKTLSNLLISLSSPPLTYSMVLITLIGGVFPSFSLVAILYLNGYRREAIYSLISLILVGVFTLYLKNLFHRPRPFWTGSLNWHHEEDIEHSAASLGYLIECMNGYSFPSGHASRVSVLLGVTYYSKNKWYPYLLFLSLIVGISRIYLILHFTSDVIFGLFFGFIIGYISSLLIDRVLIRQMNKLV